MQVSVFFYLGQDREAIIDGMGESRVIVNTDQVGDKPGGDDDAENDLLQFAGDMVVITVMQGLYTVSHQRICAHGRNGCPECFRMG